YDAKKPTDKNAIAPRRDLMLDALVEILQGKRCVHSHCYRHDEILMLLNLSDELGFHVQTLQHVLEGYKVAQEMAAHKTAGLTFSDWWGYEIASLDAMPYKAALFASPGVTFSMNSDFDASGH